jgi:hypothetical protein
MSEITEILRTKEGTGKNGKPYSLVTVRVNDDDNDVTVFGPAVVGDKVSDITLNSQFNNWQGKVVRDKPTSHNNEIAGLDVVLNQLKTILDRQDTLVAMLTDFIEKSHSRASQSASNEDVDDMPPDFGLPDD